MLKIDDVTRVEYNAGTTAGAKAQAVLAALADPVTVKVLNGNGDVMGSGTMSTPWATINDNVLSMTDVSSFNVTSNGTPDSSWRIRFESGTRWLEGSFGLLASSQEFLWSLPTWESGQTGKFGTATANTWKGTAEKDVSDWFAVADGNQIVFGWKSLDSKSIGTFTQGVGGTYDLKQDADIPPGTTASFTIISTPRVGINIDSPTNGILTIGSNAEADSYDVVVDLVSANDAEQDWFTRSTLPGTVFAHDFRSYDELQNFAAPGTATLGAFDSQWSASAGIPGCGSGKIISPAWGTRTAAAIPVAAAVGEVQVWPVTDASTFPDPASVGEYTLMLGSSTSTGETVTVTAVNYATNTFTVRRGNTRSYLANMKIGKGVDRVWNRPLCAVSGVNNGKGVDDIGITQGHSIARPINTVTDGNAIYRNPYGYWGRERVNHPTWRDYYGRNWTSDQVWEGEEFYLQFRVKFSASRFASDAVGKWFYLHTNWKSGYQQIFSTWAGNGNPQNTPSWNRSYGDSRAVTGASFSSGNQYLPGGDYPFCLLGDTDNLSTCFYLVPDQWITFLFYMRPGFSNYRAPVTTTLAADIQQYPFPTQVTEDIQVVDGSGFAATLAQLGPVNAQMNGPTVGQNVSRELVRVNSVNGNTLNVTRNIARSVTSTDVPFTAGKSISYGSRNWIDGTDNPLGWMNDPNLCPHYDTHFKVMVAYEGETEYRTVLDNPSIPHVYGEDGIGDYGDGFMTMPGMNLFSPTNYPNAYFGSGGLGAPNGNTIEYTQVILSRNFIPCPKA